VKHHKIARLIYETQAETLKRMGGLGLVVDGRWPDLPEHEREFWEAVGKRLQEKIQLEESK
jgi:hypothetical protein